MSSGKAFIRLCELDWSLGTDDIVNLGINASTLDACIDSCASWTGVVPCLGATYHYQFEFNGSLPRCYLKSTLPSAATKLKPEAVAAGGYLAQT